MAMIGLSAYVVRTGSLLTRHFTDLNVTRNSGRLWPNHIHIDNGSHRTLGTKETLKFTLGFIQTCSVVPNVCYGTGFRRFNLFATKVKMWTSRERRVSRKSKCRSSSIVWWKAVNGFQIYLKNDFHEWNYHSVSGNGEHVVCVCVCNNWVICIPRSRIIGKVARTKVLNGPITASWRHWLVHTFKFSIA